VATSYSTSVRTAIQAIGNADATLRTLTGKTSNIILSWNSAVAASKPVIALMVSANNRIGGDGDRRSVQVLLAAFAEGNGAHAKVEAMTQRVREILTPAAFQAQGVDAAVIDATDRDVNDDTLTSPTLTERSDLDLIIVGSAPQ